MVINMRRECMKGLRISCTNTEFDIHVYKREYIAELTNILRYMFIQKCITSISLALPVKVLHHPLLSIEDRSTLFTYISL